MATTRKTSTGECDACRRIIGLWQAVFTSECAHTFHLRCVSGTAACPVCAAPWSDTPTTAPAPAPATPYTFKSTTETETTDPCSSSASRRRTPMFGLGQTTSPSIIAHNYSCFDSFGSPSPPTSPSSWTPHFGQPSPSLTAVGRIPEFGRQLCPVCHGGMFRGQATVTSECNHTFHLRCLAGTSSHGDCARSGVCPVCRARWRDTVSVALPPRPQPLSAFDDDEPPSLLVQQAKDDVVQLTTRCEHPAVARDTARDDFAILVHVKAPSPAATTTGPEELPSLDLVAVLDVSGSMAAGNKLGLLKQAMSFVIDGLLGPRDRLSIVAFSCEARRILGLTRMSDGGKATAKAAVESLVTHAGTNIGGGLCVAAEVLDRRRQSNAAVTSVILLSDGKDNHTYRHNPNCVTSINIYNGLAPQSLRSTFGCRYPPPVHMFVLGTDQDAEAMHAIASVTRGSLSVIVDKEEAEAAVMQDSLAKCIGELRRSVTVQDARVVVKCLHPGVHVRAVKAAGGRYYHSLIGRAGRAASVDVGELCADEERRFLLFVSVPAVAAGDDDSDGSVTTRLIKVSCTYKDAATGRSVDVCCKDNAAVLRPVVVVVVPATTTTDVEVEVARERFSVEAAEDIAAARDAAKHGEHARAAQILDRRQEAAAGLAVAGDDECAELVAKLHELRARIAADRRRDCADRAPRVPAFGLEPSQLRASTVPFGTPAGSTFRPTAAATATGGFWVSYGLFRGFSGSPHRPAIQVHRYTSAVVGSEAPNQGLV